LLSHGAVSTGLGEGQNATETCESIHLCKERNGAPIHASSSQGIGIATASRSIRRIAQLPVESHAQPPQDYPKTNKETGKINPGEHVKVLRMGYGKDFRTWKVKGSIGQEGWFVEENDSIKFTDRRNR